MTYPTPTEPGYYWAKLKTPSDGTIYGIEGHPEGVQVKAEQDWCSGEWEIVKVWDNGGDESEELGVDVFGIYPTQWVPDFYWGPKVQSLPPSQGMTKP